MKQHYYDAECGPSIDRLKLKHKVVEIADPIQISGWTVTDKRLSVSDCFQYCTLCTYLNFFR